MPQVRLDNPFSGAQVAMQGFDTLGRNVRAQQQFEEQKKQQEIINQLRQEQERRYEQALESRLKSDEQSRAINDYKFDAIKKADETKASTEKALPEVSQALQWWKENSATPQEYQSGAMGMMDTYTQPDNFGSPTLSPQDFMAQMGAFAPATPKVPEAKYKIGEIVKDIPRKGGFYTGRVSGFAADGSPIYDDMQKMPEDSAKEDGLTLNQVTDNIEGMIKKIASLTAGENIMTEALAGRSPKAIQQLLPALKANLDYLKQKDPGSYERYRENMKQLFPTLFPPETPVIKPRGGGRPPLSQFDRG